MPSSPSVKYTQLFEVGAFVYSRMHGEYTPADLDTVVRNALNLILEQELNWDKKSFNRKMNAEQSREHWEDNVRVDADEANVPLDSIRRYMLWYEPGGGTFGNMTRENTRYDEAFFRRLEKGKK